MTIWRQKHGTTEFHVDSTKVNNATVWKGTLRFNNAHGSREIELPEPYLREYYTDTGMAVGDEPHDEHGLMPLEKAE